MNNNLKRIEKELRSFVKRCKDIKYNTALLFSFLVTGSLSLSANGKDDVETAKRGLQTSITDMKKLFKEAKAENDKLMKDSNLELVQLMEQGDHVVKSPWSSWQFGANGFYNNWRGTYKGRGDKKEKYPYEGIFERDSDILNRYISSNSSMYQYLPQSLNSRSASTTSRSGLLNTYGLAKTGEVNKPVVDMELNASIRPRSIAKASPASMPQAPSIVLPDYEPRLIPAPVEPDAPTLPNINPPQLSLKVVSNGNGSSFVAIGQANNAAIESVAITGGDINTVRTGDSWNYTYNNYSGSTPWGSATNPWGSAIPTGGSWSGKSGTGTSSGKGFLSTISGYPIINSGNILYTQALESASSTLGELYHLDIHGFAQNSSIINGLNSILANDELAAFNDAVTNLVVTPTQANGQTYTKTDTHASFNSGNIVIEGGNTSLTNTYTHTGGNKDQLTANTGKVIFQPYEDASGNRYGAYTGGFIVSNDVSGQSHNIMYNSGTIENWTKNASIFGYAGSSPKALTTVNKGNGSLKMYGQDSAGIYLLKDARLNMVLDNPMEFYGDNNVGLYIPQTASSSKVEGDFKANFGAAGVGNQKFTTTAVSNKTAGNNITNMDINPGGSSELIEGGFGIYSFAPTNLTKHTINVFDQTEGVVGVMPGADVLLNLGTGKITLDGGTTSKNNIGIYTDNKGSVKSTGDIELKDGKGNLAIVAKGSTRAGQTNNVEVGKITSTDTKNSIAIYASAGAKVKADELNISGASIENDASTVNKKNSGAVYATGTGTEVTINRATAPTGDNISIQGVRLTDADRYVGFGLMAADGAKIHAQNNKIKVTDGSTGIASVGGAEVDLTNGSLDYSGDGYALYVDNGGTIKMNNATLTLRGNSVGYVKDLAAATQPIDTTGMNFNIYSNDATAVILRNATSLNVTGLLTNVTGIAGLPTIGRTDPVSGTTYNNFTLAAIDGLGAYNIDKDVDKSLAVTGGVDADVDTFVKSLIVQRAKMNLGAGKTVTAHLNSSDLTAIKESAVIGLAMNSSKLAASNTETQINLAGGSTVSADRTDAGTGAVGLFINYGQANINSGAKVEVERTAINAANSNAVGVYAVNGSDVVNDGSISVGGDSSIGVLGLSSRVKPATGALVGDEFSKGAGVYGKISVTNNNALDLDGKGSYGIYVEDNDTANVATNLVNATNGASGVITMNGEKAVGMGGKNFGVLKNDGQIIINADEGVGMFGQSSGSVLNNNIITVGNSSSESKLRVGMFTNDQGVTLTNNGTINGGTYSYNIYGKNVTLGGTSVLNVGDGGVGVFSTADVNASPNIDIQAGATFNVGNNEAVGVFVENTPNGVTINDAGSTMTIGNNSFGYVLKGTNTTFNNTAPSTVALGDSAVYLYSNDAAANITSRANLTSSGDSTYGIYSAGTVNNYGNMNFAAGTGNVGIYSTNGGNATNYGTITVGATDQSTERYAIGMAAGFNGNATTPAFTGKVVNEGTINVKGSASIGMYGTGQGTEVYNGTSAGSTATINLDSDGAIGMYLDKNAKGYNYGTITTIGNPSGVVGVATKSDAEFTNHGTITINSADGVAAFNDGGKVILRNYGTVNLLGGATEIGTPEVKPTSTGARDVNIDVPAGSAVGTIYKNGIAVTPDSVNTPQGTRQITSSGLGMYMDTLAGTNPINGLRSLALTEMDLVIGAEAAKATNSKYIEVSGNILAPYRQTMLSNPQISKWNIYSGSLTWLATASAGVQNVYLAKLSYTNWAADKDTYNFADGLEQRYGVEELSSREKELFNKLSSIGNNEEILLFQAYDEMMGHQYANIQQRTQGTGRLIDKEITHLSKEWDTKSKQSNKIKVFGMRDEYSTDTAGIIDYTSDAYGFAYLHEDETVKLGNSSGWYAGAVHNRFKFKDIGGSKENQTMLKLGIFKTMSPATDHNGSLQWTISGEGYVSRNDMHRKYLVVDEIFNAKSDYTTYGVALKNELGYNIRTSERTSIRPYGSLKLEYGRFGSIKEKSGEIRLEVEGNDYYSVKPEVGIEFKYKQPMAVRTTFVTTLGLGYENELGRVGNVKNKARVAYTNADWFNIRGEKDDRKGNFKADLNLGIENQRVGVTFNAGYDTKGHNVRGGIGFRAIY